MNFLKLIAPLCAIGVLAGCSSSSDNASATSSTQTVATNDSALKNSDASTSPTPPSTQSTPQASGSTAKPNEHSGPPPQPGSPDPKKSSTAMAGPKLPDNVPVGEMSPGSEREAVYFSAVRALVDHVPKPAAGQAGSLSFPDKSSKAKVVSNGDNRFTVHIEATLGKTKKEYVIVVVKDEHGTFQTESVN